MGRLFDSVYDVVAGAEKIRHRPYGMIEVIDERLVAIHLRPWPKLVSGVEAKWADSWGKKRTQKNRCQLYYSQPISHRSYLTLSYVVTTLQTSWTTLSLSVALLDYVAYLKQSDAVLAEVSNSRISDRLLKRMGADRHLLDNNKRHWIKRFYGVYPENSLLKSKLGISFEKKPAFTTASS